MADILSQQEIDSLLSGISSGSVQVNDILRATRDIEKEISGYDFRRPNRISKGQLRTLQSVHEGFAEVFSYYLVSKLQTAVTINVTSLDQVFYSEFTLSITNPSCLYVFSIEGADGYAILETSPQLALMLVERLLGGSGDSSKKMRAITQIEQSVIRAIIERALSDLTNAWRSVAPLTFRLSRFESEADFVQIAPASEIVLVVSLDITVGSTSYVMNLCFPTFALDEIISKINEQALSQLKSTSPRTQKQAEHFQRQLMRTRVPIVGILGKTSISIQDLMSLQEGDVLRLSTRVDEAMEVLVGTKRKFKARPGIVENHRSVRISRMLSEEEQLNDGIS